MYRARRGDTRLSWSITLRLDETARDDHQPQTRVLIRLRLGPVRRVWLANTAGDLIDLLTIAALAAGLRERLTHR